MSRTIPRHVAIIPDGNRRWARSRGLKVFDGHSRGFEVAREVGRHAIKRDIKYLTLWGMSIENLTKRSKLEVAGLLRVFTTMFREILTDEEIYDKKVRVQVFGHWREKFPKKLRELIESVLEKTKHHDQYFLNLLLVYNGTDEMLQAVKEIVKEERASLTSGESIATPEVSPARIKQHLFTKDLPPVDLVIRTGGEPHLSAGFMMWDVADAELYFPEVYWPDFTPAEFDKALDFFAKRERRFGK